MGAQNCTEMLQALFTVAICYYHRPDEQWNDQKLKIDFPIWFTYRFRKISGVKNYR